MTDQELWEYFATKYFIGFEEAPVFKSKAVEAPTAAPLDKQVEYVKNRFRPLLPDAYEFIKRKSWYPLAELRGKDMTLLKHPLWDVVNQYIYENFQPCSQNLIVQQCSGQKPYIDNTNYVNKNLNFSQEGYCDLAINSICLVPIEFTVFYPFRHYDWGHINADKEVNDALLDINVSNIIKVVETFDYKKVLLHGPYNDDWKYLYEKVSEHFANTPVAVYLVFDETLYQIISSTPAKKTGEARGRGIISYRYSDFTEIKDRIKQLLDYNPKQPLRNYMFGQSIKKAFPQDFYDMNNGQSATEWEIASKYPLASLW